MALYKFRIIIIIK